MVRERRRRSDFFSHLARSARVLPRVGRSLPLCGGDGDLLNADRFEDAIQPALTSCRNVILGISNLRYIDGTGLRVIVGASKVLQRNDRQLVVAGAPPGIAKVMHILHADALSSSVSSVEAAASHG